VPHRHVILTMPRLLRGLLRKRRELLLDLSQCGAEAPAEYIKDTGRARCSARHRRISLESDVFALKDLRVDGVFAYTTASFEQALRIVESGKLDVRPLITHTLPLHEFARAFDLLSNRPEPVVKVMLRP